MTSPTPVPLSCRLHGITPGFQSAPPPRAGGHRELSLTPHSEAVEKSGAMRDAALENVPSTLQGRFPTPVFPAQVM